MNEIKSSCRYMVVFQYGSAVLFNIEDHEAVNYLETIRRHASGFLPEMRKDGKSCILFHLNYSVVLVHFLRHIVCHICFYFTL